jgi:hypothetical protein
MSSRICYLNTLQYNRTSFSSKFLVFFLTKICKKKSTTDSIVFILLLIPVLGYIILGMFSCIVIPYIVQVVPILTDNKNYDVKNVMKLSLFNDKNVEHRGAHIF